MSDRAGLHCSCNEDVVYHKGFYNDENFIKSLAEICYDDFFESPNDDEFSYNYADVLLCGACHIFAESLQKKLGYNLYIIESIDKKGFHAFCQVCIDNRLYYVDARGMTSSFDEFMEIARQLSILFDLLHLMKWLNGKVMTTTKKHLPLQKALLKSTRSAIRCKV